MATSGPRLSASRSRTDPEPTNEIPEEDDAVGEELAAEHGSLHGDETVSNGEDTGEAGEGDAQGSAQTPTPAGRDTDSATAWDTDLEIDDEQEDFDMYGANVYFETCRELGVVPVSYFVRHLRNNELVMRHHGLGSMGAKAIAVPLVSNTVVTELDLEDNWLEAAGAHYISDMLKENCYITHLNLADNKIGTNGSRPICEMMVSNSTLTHVNLSGNNFQDKDAQLFAAAILENSRIQHLSLSHNSFGPGSGVCLGHAIGENETLESLDLSWNNFRCQSGIEIMNGIQVNSRLKRVNMAWNGLGMEGAAATSACLKNNSILTELDISSNRITQEAAAIIGKGLEANETLKIFRCGKNPIGSNGALCILGSIHNERSILDEIDLTEVWVDENFESLHKEILQGRPELVVIHSGILGIKGSQATEANPEDSELTDLDRFLQNDPMAILKSYVLDNNLRMIDLFKQFDKNNDHKISKEEFEQGIKSTNVNLTNEQIDTLMDKLDCIDRDGHVDYRELMTGSFAVTKETRRLLNAQNNSQTMCVLQTNGDVLKGDQQVGLVPAAPTSEETSEAIVTLKMMAS